MAIFDALEFLDLLDFLISWRLLATAIGIVMALGLYFLSGETPTGAAVAFAVGFVGVCTGLVWQFRHERRR